MSRSVSNNIQIPLPIRPVSAFHWDLRLVGLVAVLLTIGLVVLTSASLGIAQDDFGNPFAYVVRQLQALTVGVVALAFMLIVPSETWFKFSPLLLLLALVLLAVVLVPEVGVVVNGSQRWVNLAGIRVQVSEPARLALIMYIAGYAVRQQETLETRFLGLAKPFAVLCLAAALLLAEPDLGAATVLMATALVVLFCAGARIRDLMVFGVLACGAFVALIFDGSYRESRIFSFLNPWADPHGDGYQLTNSLMAIGRGEWFGVGLGNSVQKLFYLPEAHTDFVFAVYAEEFGLAGVAVMVLVLLLLVLRILGIARDAALLEHWFAAYTVLGVGVWLGLQSFVNLGVNLGILPTKGLTLPLVSYGRSSMIIVLAALGFVLRVHHENVIAAAKPKARKRRRQ
ncbi:MAG: putative lipid II flippase FtsW [Pseudomonadota bacterium]